MVEAYNFNNKYKEPGERRATACVETVVAKRDKKKGGQKGSASDEKDKLCEKDKL